MEKIPFRVSARAARLIGRENVATSQGAVTELVKNAYDADASACAILFLRRHEKAPLTVSENDFAELLQILPDAAEFYPENDGPRVLSGDLTEEQSATLNTALENVLDLWIVDNGSGMTAAIINDRWMVIGTAAKEVDSKSIGGRIVTGAKGIGRFALDRLGQECELFSGQAQGSDIVHWLVDWGDFEGEGKVIDDVLAVLDTEQKVMTDVYREQRVLSLLPTTGPAGDGQNEGPPLSFSSGTAIRISHLHDRWDERDTLKLRETLEALLPPKDRGDFNIYVHDHRSAWDGGWIDNFPPDQFDYRMVANVHRDGSVTLKLDRHEIDSEKITPTTFTLDEMKVDGFRKADFERGSIKYTKTLREILRLKQDQPDEEYRAIGPFDFTFYFMKLNNPTKDNLERYPQRSFDVTKRKRWMRNSGGIRLYRDQFRVRPYGEPNTQGSDWLLLGQRVAQNPAAASRISWRVPPQQVAGTIHITKSGNPLLADQSNREGIINERVFTAFREIVLALIREFEQDRGYINRAFDKAYDLDHPDEKTIADGTALAGRLLRQARNQPQPPSWPQPPPSKDAGVSSQPGQPDSGTNNDLALAKAVDAVSRRNVALEGELQTLRGMATLGTVLVSFTHELKQIKGNLNQRKTRMTNALDRVVDPERLKSIPQQVNPYDMIERWSDEDAKIARWVDFALSSVSPTKRRRTRIDLRGYVDALKTYWIGFTETKSIDLRFNYGIDHPVELLGHEIDLDSIFYNLIVNSIEAFAMPSDMQSRVISLEVALGTLNDVAITYRDDGPGLSTMFKSPNEIFGFEVSSKADARTGEVTGTGIGMWLLKSIVDDYSGTATILSKTGERGFGIAVTLPIAPPAPSATRSADGE